MGDTLLDDAQRLAGEIVAWRRTLHAHPELSGQEKCTARFIAEQLTQMGLTPSERVGDTYGVSADLRAGDQPFVALRADFDALPVQEETGAEYASKVPGVMHACGHDAHSAMLLGAARLLLKHESRLHRSVRLIFQPHEELYPGGAAAMIEAGVLEGVESIFGIHLCTNLRTGELGTRTGPFMAAVNPLSITVRGKGGHAAMPERCIDPVVAAAHVIVALQTVVSRWVAVGEPAVVSITQIEAGTADNVIPKEARLTGTIRTFGAETRSLVCERVQEIAVATAQAHRATAEVRIHPGYPALLNDENATRRALAAASKLGIERDRLMTLPPQGVGEDFAYYCQQIPGAFVFLGAANADKHCAYPHHHPRFNVDEEVLPWGAALHAQFALTAAPS